MAFIGSTFETVEAFKDVYLEKLEAPRCPACQSSRVVGITNRYLSKKDKAHKCLDYSCRNEWVVQRIAWIDAFIEKHRAKVERFRLT